ncbi:MAG: glutaredoxin family protein [Burkholderiales bacterium]
MAALTLIIRTYCHLCDDMAVALEPLLREFSATVKLVDVDRDPLLEEKYGMRVPVLLHAENELCHYFLDRASVRDYLARLG